MASNWRGIVQVGENEDRRPLWQRRTSRRTPTTLPESGSESGAGTTGTSSGASRSSSVDDGLVDDRLNVPQSRTDQQISPIVTNRFGITRFDDRSVGRSSSFREPIAVTQPSTPAMGQYRRSGSPYHSRHPPISARGSSAGDHLTADYVPSWRPDRRFSTPAVPRYRGSFSRSPSPRFLGKKGPPGTQQQFENFRSRAASLPANGSINSAVAASGTAIKRRNQQQRQQHQDYWPPTRSPSRVEQRFLKLSESADYDKVRTFVIGAKGELVERGFCYRHRSETASSSSAGSTGPTASPNDDAVMANESIILANLDSTTSEPLPSRTVPKYTILVLGATAVGKTSLLSLLLKSQESDEPANAVSVDSEPGVTMLPVLICGEEVHLEFYEFCVTDVHSWSSIPWQAAMVVYSISDKRSFSAAADALYQIRAQTREAKYRDPASPIPIVLVANKIDLERQRQVQDQDGMELAKSYDCRFVDVSVELTHHIDELLSSVMNEIWRCTVTAYRQRHMQSFDLFETDDSDMKNSTDKKPKRFSFRKSKQAKPIVTVGQPRSSRARSLYTLPAGLPTTLSSSSSNHSGHGFLSRLLGRRAAQSCEDLFSRLLRG